MRCLEWLWPQHRRIDVDGMALRGVGERAPIGMEGSAVAQAGDGGVFGTQVPRCRGFLNQPPSFIFADRCSCECP